MASYLQNAITPNVEEENLFTLHLKATMSVSGRNAWFVVLTTVFVISSAITINSAHYIHLWTLFTTCSPRIWNGGFGQDVSPFEIYCNTPWFYLYMYSSDSKAYFFLKSSSSEMQPHSSHSRYFHIILVAPH